MRTGWGALLPFLLLGLGVLAQEKTPPKKPETAPLPSNGGPAPERDPTQASPKLRDLLEAPKAGAGFVPLPVLVLRGRILVTGQPAVALIELDAKQWPVPVTTGTVLSIGGRQLRVVDITAAEVRIEVSPRNEILILR